MKKKPLILGLGLTGLAVAEFFESKNIPYFACDDKLQKYELSKYKEMEFLNLAEALKVEFDYLVVSPGVNPGHLVYQKAIASSVKIISEIELALDHLSSKVIGITGTNGKTTVTKFLEEGLKKIGFDAIACGNYGKPLISFIGKETPNTVFCCELSSYQLENTFLRKIDYGIILNITQDHLDRYGTMQAYAEAKFHLIDLIKSEGEIFIQKKLSLQFPNSIHAENIVFYDDRTLPLEGLSQFSSREKENWIAAFLILKKFKMTDLQMNELLINFHKPEHRIEHVADVNGVKFYDDSKGTNVDAVIFAVEKFQEPLILLLGGKDKSSDYSPWIEAFKDRVKKVIAFGQAKEKIQGVLNPYYDVAVVENLEDAANLANNSSTAGDIVLLSPGCSSFDQFKDYKHRAEVYRNCIKSFSSQKS